MQRGGCVAKGAEGGAAEDTLVLSTLTPSGIEFYLQKVSFFCISSEDHNVCLYLTMGKLVLTAAGAHPGANSEPQTWLSYLSHILGQDYTGCSIPVPFQEMKQLIFHLHEKEK